MTTYRLKIKRKWNESNITSQTSQMWYRVKLRINNKILSEKSKILDEVIHSSSLIIKQVHIFSIKTVKYSCEV